jgi:ABC-type transporter Mla maintaining outer membrane lipid asymmetry permease subunit MlaE
VYVSTACMLLGYVAQDFVFRYLPYRQFSEPLLLENLLHATGFSLYRFLVPILATLLVAARSGAAVTANLGSKVYGGQLDALRSVGADPQRLLKTAVLISFIVGVPLLSVIGYFVAAWSAGYAFLLDHGELGVAFWNAHFHQQLVVDGRVLYRGTEWLLPRLVCCGAGTGVIAWLKGTAPKQSAAEISDAVTGAILWSTLYVLLVHFLFSLFEFVPQA